MLIRQIRSGQPEGNGRQHGGMNMSGRPSKHERRKMRQRAARAMRGQERREDQRLERMDSRVGELGRELLRALSN